MRELFVDPEWYTARYPEAALALQTGAYESLEQHFLDRGQERNFDPSPYFATAFVKKRAGGVDLGDDVVRGYIHELSRGEQSPHWLSDEVFHLARHAPARGAKAVGQLICGLQYYLRFTDVWAERPHPLVDVQFYRGQIRGRAPAHDPLLDYQQRGAAEGLRLSALFDGGWYAHQLAQRGLTVADHYLTPEHHFLEEGMFLGLSASPDFEEAYYLARHPEAADQVEEGRAVSPFWHFLVHGVSRGAAPNPYFDGRYYRDKNPEVQSEIEAHGLLGPFEHFVRFGAQRGLRARAPLVRVEVPEEFAKATFEKRSASTAAHVRTLDFAPVEAPTVTAIIPCYNDFNYTWGLLAQLHAGLGGRDVGLEVVVVDNGSSDATRSLPERAFGIVYKRLPAAVGYTKACNLGAEGARGEFLLFTNNDIEVFPGAIEALVRRLRDNPRAGAAGPRILLTDERLQEAGGLIWRGGSGQGFGRGENPWKSKFSFGRPVDYCSGAFLMVRRQDFERLQSFDEQFSPGYYEDTDLCLRLWEAGREVWYEPDSVIRHYEYASYSRGRPPSASIALMAGNQKKFAAAHQQTLTRHPSPDQTTLFQAAFRLGRPFRHVLVLDDLPPVDALGSGFGRTRDVVEEFMAAGWLVTLAVQEVRSSHDPADHGLGGLDVNIIGFSAEALDKLLREYGDTVDLVWTGRTHNINFAAETVRNAKARLPALKAVADTEAVASLREIGLRRLAGASEAFALNPASAIRRELSGVEPYDVVVAVNEVDRAALAAAVDKPVAVVGHRFAARPAARHFEERADFLFFGAVHEGLSPNFDSVAWLASEVWPRVRERLPLAELHVYGYWRPNVPRPENLEGMGLRLMGEGDIDAFIHDYRVFVAPTRFAGGIPHKVQNAMSYGLPCVVTELLARQLGFTARDTASAPALWADATDPAGFAAAMVELYTDAELWRRLSGRATAYVEQELSPERFSGDVEGVLRLLGF